MVAASCVAAIVLQLIRTAPPRFHCQTSEENSPYGAFPVVSARHSVSLVWIVASVAPSSARCAVLHFHFRHLEPKLLGILCSKVHKMLWAARWMQPYAFTFCLSKDFF